MKSTFFGNLLLPAMVLAVLVASLSNSSTRSITLFDVGTTNISNPLVHRQVDPMTSGAACFDEGAWLCMSDNFQRCASGEWSIVQKCAPGTQCEPLGLTHNASQPAFGIHDGSSGTVTTDVGTTTFSVEPVTKTTTTDIVVTGSGSASSSVATLSSVPTLTKTGTSTTSSSGRTASPGAPKADTSDGARVRWHSWSTVGMMYTCLPGCLTALQAMMV